MDFVVLRSKEGERLVNVDHIICFEAGPFNSLVVHVTGGKSYSVIEIPQEIMAAVRIVPEPPVAEPEPTTPKIKKPLSES